MFLSLFYWPWLALGLFIIFSQSVVLKSGKSSSHHFLWTCILSCPLIIWSFPQTSLGSLPPIILVLLRSLTRLILLLFVFCCPLVGSCMMFFSCIIIETCHWFSTWFIGGYFLCFSASCGWLWRVWSWWYLGFTLCALWLLACWGISC